MMRLFFRFSSSFTLHGTSDCTDPHDKSVHFTAITEHKGALMNKTVFLENLIRDMLDTMENNTMRAVGVFPFSFGTVFAV